MGNRTRLGRMSKALAGSFLVVVLAVVLAGSSLAQEYFDSYGLKPASAALDLGIQPLGYPSGVLSAVMRHDRILKTTLAELGHPLQAHPFRRGADMVKLLADRRLEAGLLGDMPTILAASSGSVWIVGLVKQTSTAIVARGDIQLASLAGKRIAYVDGSSAHQTLLQGLKSASLNETDVKLVNMGVDAMPEALEKGDIDAFAAWEPAPTIALAQKGRNRIVFRGQSTDYFVVERGFADEAPKAADALIAGYLRAIEWMRRSQKNVEKAAQWAMEDAQALSGKASGLSVAQIVAITRREILNVPSAPTILANPSAPQPLKAEFEFLTLQKKIPSGSSWENVANALSYQGLANIMADRRGSQVGHFDYEN